MTPPYDDQVTYVPGSPDASDRAQPRQYNKTRFPFEINSRYQCIELLGEGTSGAVYRAYDTQLQREVAIKFIHDGMLQERKRLLAEGRVLAHLDHRNICKVYEVAEEGNAVYLVMSLVRGQHLNHWRENLSEHQRIELIAQVCDAVAEAHRRGIVHCDIKPGNIVIQEDVSPLTAVLIDFGIADSRHYATASGAGTQHYMAPERLSPGSKLIPAIDIYAIGATLRLILTGSHSNSGLSALPRDLRLIIQKCMAADATARYDSAALVAKDLRAVIAFQPISCRSGVWYRSKRMWQRNLWLRNTTWVGICLALTLLIMAGLYRAHLQDRQVEQVRWHEQVTFLESQIDAIYRSPLHQSNTSLGAIRGQTTVWAERANSQPRWLAASQLAAAGRVQAKLGNIRLANRTLRRAWDLGERSDSTAMALATVYQNRYTNARSFALNLPTKQARQQALQQAHEELREPALAYLRSVERSNLPNDYIEAMTLYLEGNETAAIHKLRTGEFPPSFYDQYVLELQLLIPEIFTILVRRQPGDASPMVERLTELDEIIRDFIPSSASIYMILAGAYIEFTRYYPGEDGELTQVWHQLSKERIEQGLAINPIQPQLHRLYGYYQMQRLRYEEPGDPLPNIRHATRHYELAIRYGKAQQLEASSMTRIYSSYLNQLRQMQTKMVNLGLSTQPLFHRAQVLTKFIPPESQGPTYHINAAREYRHMAEHAHASERDKFWQLHLEAARMSYTIAPSIPTVQANYGVNLYQHAAYKNDREALPYLEKAIQHLGEAREALPENVSIEYNYARALLAFALRGNAHDTQAAIEQAAEHLMNGIINFKSVDFFNHLYSDTLLFRPPPAHRQLTPLQRVDKVIEILDASSHANPGLGKVRYLMATYQRWRLTDDADDLQSVITHLEATLENQYLRAYPYAASVMFWVGGDLLKQREAMLHEFTKNIPSTPLVRDTELSYQFLDALTNSFKKGSASKELVALCEETRNRPFWEDFPEDKWQPGARLAKVAERDYALLCIAADHPQLMLL